MKRWLAIATVISLASAASWVAFAWADKKDESRTLSVAADAPADDVAKGLIVHEWGTFTSFSGSDGIRLEFRPLLDSDLPSFVHDRSRHAGDVLTKRNYRALVRMETPVTYFYTDEPRTIRARVSFPEGLLTEFYPPVAKISPAYNWQHEPPMKDTALDWGQVQLIPQSHIGERATGELATLIDGRSADELLPQSGAVSEIAVEEHYNYARETDSALVHVHRTPDSEVLFGASGDFFEKFLFYRGLGSFHLPLQVESLGQNRFTVTNSGSEDLSWIMVLTVNDGALCFGSFDGVAAGQQREVSLADATVSSTEMEEELQKALLAEGLYEKEAKAMIKTWRSSWFSEQGTRVLYMVPQCLTDEMLPLEIEPRPEKIVRVLVGRLDVMTKEAEASALAMVERSAAARARAAKQAKEQGIDLVYPIPDDLQRLGRFAEPALARIYAVASDPAVAIEAAQLLDQLQAKASSDLSL